MRIEREADRPLEVGRDPAGDSSPRAPLPPNTTDAELPRPSMWIVSAGTSSVSFGPDHRGRGTLLFGAGALVIAAILVAIQWELYLRPWFPSRVRELIGINTPVTEFARPAEQGTETPVPDRGPGATVDRFLVSDSGYIWPAVGRITQEYGCTDFGLEPWNADLGCRFHHGVDISGLSGTPILAAVPGSVVFAGWLDDGYGYRVVMAAPNGWTMLYAHLCCPPELTAGQSIARGEQIGLMGTTGASSGNHLHFAIEANGATLNPRELLPPEISTAT